MTEPLTLIFLSQKNVRDDIFLKDFSAAFQWKAPVLIVHDTPFTQATDTLFLGKRISGFLSESMVTNIPVSAEQRNLLSRNAGRYEIREDLLQQWFRMSAALVLSIPVPESETSEIDHILQDLYQQISVREFILFPDNPLSPLGMTNELISEPDRLQTLMEIYPEEKEVLQRAVKLLPVRILTPKNYSRDPQN